MGRPPLSSAFERSPPGSRLLPLTGQERAMTTTATYRPALWTPGDWNAFFGFGTNILVSMLTRMLVPKPKKAFQSPGVQSAGRYVAVVVIARSCPVKGNNLEPGGLRSNAEDKGGRPIHDPDAGYFGS